MQTGAGSLGGSRAYSAADIADALRERICLSSADGETALLHEASLAKEFGVSRTPVRQALQRLAYERLVTVRSGVGTVIAPLDPADRQQHIAVCAALLDAAARCSTASPVPPALMMDLASYLGMLSAAVEPDIRVHYRLRAQLLRTTVSLVEDDILSDAIAAAYWRLTRWRLQSFARDPKQETESFRSGMNAVIAAAGDGDTSAVLRAIAETTTLD
ncbi:MAG: GntR family transcriptional regulator [Pseudomonadota bacterium]